MEFFRQMILIARFEAAYFLHYPKLFLATAAVLVVPSIYTLIYLSSVWDPDAHTSALAVALVNLDQGTHYRARFFNAGEEVVATLRARGQFGFKAFSDEQEARRLVAAGKLSFALIIPSDFSAKAVLGSVPGSGELVVFASEGNNYESGAIAKHFAETLAAQINARLNELRWGLVLAAERDAQHDVASFRKGLLQLDQGARLLSRGATQTALGARSLADGSHRLDTGVEQLTAGVRQFSAGVSIMNASFPPDAELSRLKAGANSLVAGHGELGMGMAELQEGSKQLAAGMTQFQDETRESLFVPAAVAEGSGRLSDGALRIDAGVNSAWQAQQRLADGAGILSKGVGELADGVLEMQSGIRTAVGYLPEERQLEALTRGASGLVDGSSQVSGATQKLAAGAGRLSSGLEQMVRALPREGGAPEGSPQGLANPVRASFEVAAPVRNNGSGFAPNVIPCSLWLGAGVIAFLLHVRVLPRQAMFFPRLSQLLGKILLPSGFVALQALLVFLTVRYVLKIPVSHPAAFAAVLEVSALVFLQIVFVLTRAFGDAGKGAAMILLAVQFSSSGGILPVELSGSLFADISPWLPLTWTVKALRASLFGAFNDVWLRPLLIVGVSGVLAILVGCTVGRWRFAHPTSLRPTVDF